MVEDMAKVLIVGESWVVNSLHTKGWDQFHSADYGTGHKHLKEALLAAGHWVEHLPAHLVATELASTLDGLQQHDVIIISDVGANTILLHPDTFLRGERTPNRLRLLREYVRAGGGLVMAGGYMTFQGINGVARYSGTQVEEALPVTMHPWDDRLEEPEGLTTTVELPDHPLVAGMSGEWPPLLGLNEVRLKDDGALVASAGGRPLLACGEFGAGRSVAWTSDVGPHWCPPEFLAWPGYARLWSNVVDWLTRRAEPS